MNEQSADRICGLAVLALNSGSILGGIIAEAAMRDELQFGTRSVS